MEYYQCHETISNNIPSYYGILPISRNISNNTP